MKIKKFTAYIGLLLISLSANGYSLVTLSFDNGTLTPTATIISPGDSFSFDIKIFSTAEELATLTYFLEVLPGGSNLFSITGRTATSGGVFPDLLFNNSTVLADPSSRLDPVNNHDLGGVYGVDFGDPLVLHQVANITITSSALISAGVYNITFSDSTSVGDSTFADSQPVRGTYTVTVVPEPSTLLLGSLGMCALFLRRRRR